MPTARLEYNGQSWELPVVEGTEKELGIDISDLRSKTGMITLDEGYANTGSCQSAITYIDGDKGILRYRGYPIEQLAEQSTFVETAWLVIGGRLPNEQERARFSALLTKHEMIHESMRNHFEGFPNNAPPMAILSAMINAIGCFDPEVLGYEDEYNFEESAARLISQVRSIAAATYKMSIGQPMMYPRPDFAYVENFLHMMFSVPYGHITPDPDVAHALNQFLILHADHEQNCGTSTVRMVASSRREHVRLLRRRRERALGEIARRRQHGRHRDARGDPQVRNLSEGLHGEGQGEGLQTPPDGFRAPRSIAISTPVRASSRRPPT